MTKEEITALLATVVHPETDRDIVSSGMVCDLDVTDDKVRFVLKTDRPRDPFAPAVKKAAVAAVTEVFPDAEITAVIKEPAPKAVKKDAPEVDKSGIGHVIAVSSGKGGVGKSTVTAGLAVTLARMGYRVGVLDADIYGPSMPKMFGLEEYMPTAVGEDGHEMIAPAERYGVKVMSIGFFIKAEDALAWRGPMATNALRQLMHQTLWGELDFLLIDLPPGTGDVHLTVMQEMGIDGAVIVSTPQQVAQADVLRGISMFRSQKASVPVIGIVENMSWFTPRELPDNRYYIFGRDGVAPLAEREGIELLAQVPLVMGVSDGGDNGRPAALTEPVTIGIFEDLARKLTDKIK
ncbi:MAG: Mrp/NBP35 family ATP-binding protein [Rikenellaceae bacterium]|jgi:ATP-binding protein involved in chromosome partitioning|nr:Mrp/NBP35 family ATP-binding protein [Rikenellaceae bacterium]